MLKNRLAKLEQSINQKDEQKIYVVSQDNDRNRIAIAGLNFLGTMENGRNLMDQYPSAMFVIMNIPDNCLDDAEWSQMTQQMCQ